MFEQQKQHCISTSGVNVWNMCDRDLIDCGNIDIFKKQYKRKIIHSLCSDNNYL